MRRWLKEPLLHFLLAGALLFAAYGWLNRENDSAARVVHITTAEVTWLKQTWARQWQRPPTEPELRGLVASYLKETLLAREAKAMGLDEDDTVIRRRLAQKMEFLMQDTARLAEPGEDVLRRFYEAGHARYQAPAHISFTQLFFKTEAAARKGLAQLPARSPDELGDPSMLEREHAEADERAVASQFGDAFGREVFGLETGQWHGPLASGYGFHLVRVSARQDGQPRPFAEVRARVLEDWQRDQQAKASEQFLDGLLKKYDVVVEDGLKSLIGPLPVALR